MGTASWAISDLIRSQLRNSTTPPAIESCLDVPLFSFISTLLPPLLFSGEEDEEKQRERGITPSFHITKGMHSTGYNEMGYALARETTYRLLLIAKRLIEVTKQDRRTG